MTTRGTKICEHLIQSQLYDEAIASYKKFNQNVEAVKDMLNYKKSIQAASDWAQHCDEPAVWGEAGRAQLAEGLVVDAIDSFVKARDTKEYNKVIQLCEEQNQYGALVTFLELAREIQNRDPIIETELCFAYAKTDKLAELEELTSGPNSAREKEVADRCFECKLYKAAKIIYTAIKDYTRLTETLPGLQVVVEADLITDVIELYENLGYFTQIIQLLEAAMSLERAHGGIFTELAVLYAKHQPEKVLEHLKTYYQKIALFKVIKQLNLMHMWKELTFAYEKYSEYDNAVLVMMEHPSTSWEHGHFKDLISQVSNADILYRSLTFYLNYSPLDLNELLGVIGQKIDSTRVVEMFRRSNNLQLIKTYLASIQSNNIQAVNEALNQMYIEDGDYESLRHSIDSFDLFESVTLARSLEHHECLEFRRIASYIYRKSKRWNEAITLSKKDKLYGDCIETAAQSQKSDIAESLLHYFVDEKLYECFAACTFVCYDLITSDVVLELAWRNNCIDFAMPYLIQSLREQNQIISKLTSQMGDMDEKIDETKEVAQMAVSCLQAPPGFAPSNAPFPDSNSIANSTGGFNMGNNTFVASADPFAAAAKTSNAQNTFNGTNSAGNFPTFNAQFPPF
ncbi:Clathrin and VPS domain-containing protein [Histomonas meleagridis]|nr:Clathrin and VPS domain-containing protein [Histomonas meleagridis]